ncbi:MAG: cytochrome D1 domain-containing protein [Chloroflexota bacterium]
MLSKPTHPLPGVTDSSLDPQNDKLSRRRFLWLAGLAPLALAACGQTIAGQDTASASAKPAVSAATSAGAKPVASAAASSKPSALTSAASSISSALSPPAQTIAVFNAGSKDVTLIDAAQNEVTGTKPLGASIHWLGEEQAYWDGKLIWTYDFPDNKLVVLAIDPASWQVVKRIPAGNGPGHSVILSKDHKTASINVAGDNKLLSFDTSSNAQTGSVDVGKFPCDLDGSLDGKILYSPERDQDTVAMFDAATLKLMKRVEFPSGSKPHMLRVSPDGQTVWVQTADAGTNVVLKASDLSTLATEKVGKTPVTNAWSPDGKWALVTNQGENTATLFDATTFKPVKTITVGQSPGIVSFRQDGKFAYVAVTGANTVAVIDTATWTVAKTLRAGQQPQGVIVLPPNPR